MFLESAKTKLCLPFTEAFGEFGLSRSFALPSARRWRLRWCVSLFKVVRRSASNGGGLRLSWLPCPALLGGGLEGVGGDVDGAGGVLVEEGVVEGDEVGFGLGEDGAEGGEEGLVGGVVGPEAEDAAGMEVGGEALQA